VRMPSKAPAIDDPHATIPPLSERIYLGLVEEIAAGRYAINSKLPGEMRLAQHFGVSRPVLRQALSRLRNDGLIVSRQGAGNFVVRKNDRAPLNYGPLHSIPDVQRCLEFRCAIESDAARRAAMISDEESCAAVEGAIRAMEHAAATGQLSVEADFDFHIAIARATRNRFYPMTLEALRGPVLFGISLIRSLSTAPHDERRKTVLTEHRLIYNAIREQQPERAQQAMTAHLEAGIARLFNE
jgi:GntR family transcriptional regulator, transcriptional repressor for pyruvate dehydrogenase complex